MMSNRRKILILVFSSIASTLTFFTFVNRSRVYRFLLKQLQPTAEEKAHSLIKSLPEYSISHSVALEFIQIHVETSSSNHFFEIDEETKVRFLLSTDYVQNGCKNAKPLAWVAYYSPWVTPCYNPFNYVEPLGGP